MAQTVMITLARAEGLEPSTLGFGDCCFVNENSENACKLPENVQRTRAQSANHDFHRFALFGLATLLLSACGQIEETDCTPITQTLADVNAELELSPGDESLIERKRDLEQLLIYGERFECD